MLYENQKEWHEAFDVRPIFEGYAKKIGLDVERFKTDVNSEPVAQRIFLDGEAWTLAGSQRHTHRFSEWTRDSV